MRFMLSVDYELYFGRQTGTVERCILEPTRQLVQVLERHGQRLVLFVDVMFLAALEREAEAGCSDSAEELAAIRSQLRALASRGHELQLHLHVHWLDCRRLDGVWQMDLSRYRLHDLAAEEQQAVVAAGVAELADLAGRAPVAYRAGGWSMQPFADIAPVLAANGIRVESTVFAGGHSAVPGRPFDFRRAPTDEQWRFERDPLQPDASGGWREVPITGFTAAPWLFWRMALGKLRSGPADQPMGDGQAAGASGGYYLQRLLWPSRSPATIDGFKAAWLDAALAGVRRRGQTLLHTMGHPKSLSQRSLGRLDDFLGRHPDLAPAVLSDFQLSEAGGAQP